MILGFANRFFDFFSNFCSIFFLILFSIFSKNFGLFCSFLFFSGNGWRRDDSFGPKIVEFRAILAIFRPFEDLLVDRRLSISGLQVGCMWLLSRLQVGYKYSKWFTGLTLVTQVGEAHLLK